MFSPLRSARGAAAALVVLCSLLWPQRSHGETLVDVALVIAADVSFSMDREERRLQQTGFVAAFRNPDVIRAIESGPAGRIAVTYIEWGGRGRHRVVVPWMVIGDAAGARDFAALLERSTPARFNRGTSIASALAKAHEMLRTGGFASARRIVNISGNGIEQDGAELARVRAELVADDITINGLPIVYDKPLEDIRDALAMRDPSLLLDHFEREVIGGAHAFVEPVVSVESYGTAIGRKILREIASPIYATLESAPEVR